MSPKTMISRMTNTQAEARPLRVGIRKNQQPQKKTVVNFKGILKTVATLFLLALIGVSAHRVTKYIEGLKAQRDMLNSQLQDQFQLQRDNTAKVAFFEGALRKTFLTSYVPQLGGINGNGKAYANGEPVIPIAASRKALRTGSVKMGDYVLLVGQIKDTKGSSITDHSFDVQAPNADVASMIGKRAYSYVNLSTKGSPYSKTLPTKK